MVDNTTTYQNTVSWTGGGTDIVWNDSNNWSGGFIPDEKGNTSVFIGGVDGNDTSVVINNAIADQVARLEIGKDATVTLISQSVQTPWGGGNLLDGFAFNSLSTVIDQGGELVVNTASNIELGNSMVVNGTLSLLNSNKVIVDDGNISGSGTINLIGSTLGQSNYPYTLSGNVNVTMQGGSTLYANISGMTGTINFDPSSANYLYVDGSESQISADIQNFSENSVIQLLSSDNYKMTGTQMSQNADGSWSLTIDYSNGSTTTLSDINFASGFNPASVTIDTDSNGNQYLDFVNQQTTTYTKPTDLNNTSVYVNNDVNTAIQAPVVSQNQADGEAENAAGSPNNWTGAAGDNNWFNANNWSLGNNPYQDTSDNTNIYGSADNKIDITIDKPMDAQLAHFNIGDYATIRVTAVAANPESYAFSALKVYMGGQHSHLIIDTPSKVEFGPNTFLPNDTAQIDIIGNRGNVVFDGVGVAGSGTINLINSTLGSETQQNGYDVTVTLSDNSVLYTRWNSSVSSPIVVDPNTVNTIYFYGDNGGTISTPIEGFSANTRIGIDSSSNYTPNGNCVWSQNSDGSYTLNITMVNDNSSSDVKTLTISDIQFTAGQSPSTFSSPIQQADGSWILQSSDVQNVYTWVGPDHDGDLNNVSNWNYNGAPATTIPTKNDTVVFNNGDNIQLSPNQTFAFGNVEVKNGTTLSFTNAGQSATSLVTDTTSSVYVTAPSGTVSLGDVVNYGSITSATNLNMNSLTNEIVGTVSAQNGLNVTTSVSNQGTIEVWGGYTQGGVTYNSSASIPTNNLTEGDAAHFVINNSKYTCFTEETRFILASSPGTLIIRKVCDLKFDDELASGGRVKWLGRKLIPAGTMLIRLGNLTVTPDHLILQDDVLVPAQECRGAKEVIADKEQYVYHFQTEKHSLVCANGVWSDTMMHDPSREPMETVFGELNMETAMWGINTAKPLRNLFSNRKKALA